MADRAAQVERATDALNRQDFDALAEVFHPDIEHQSVFAAVEGAVYHGIEGQRQRWENVTGTWDDFRVAVEEVVPDGDESIVVLRLTGVARASRMPLDAQLTQVWTWRGDRVARIVTKPPNGGWRG